jgi:hypothetical protein
MQATRGWEVAALLQGVRSVPPKHAPAFGLFCRWARVWRKGVLLLSPSRRH